MEIHAELHYSNRSKHIALNQFELFSIGFIDCIVWMIEEVYTGFIAPVINDYYSS